MASTYSHSNSSINRKSLRRPDQFVTAVGDLFHRFTENGKAIILLLLALLGVGCVIVFMMNRSENRSEAAQNALYQAQKAREKAHKVLVTAETPSKPSDPKAKDAATRTPPASSAVLQAIAFKKMDVDAQFAEAVKEFKKVDQEFGSTRAAFEARVQLADLYFNHGEYNKSVPWFEKAADSAPGNFEKALALSSLGYAKENATQFSEAIQAFRKALNLGEGTLKGDLLLGIARNYEAVHDLTQARSTYDQILAELPGTEAAKAAEIFKKQLR